MPNRILREGILSSERVCALDWEAEVFYRRLMSVVDDFGRYSAHPALLRAALYPLQLDKTRESNMERLLASVEQARLVRLYSVDGKKFLEMHDFRQQVRAKVSKFPEPPSVCASSATQTHSTRCADEKHLRTKTYSYSETETKAKDPPVAVEWVTAKGVEIPGPLRTAAFRTAWHEWEDHLRKRGVKRSDVADRKQLNACMGWGAAAAVKNIDHSIAGNYQGIYEAPVRRSSSSSHPKSPAAAGVREDV